ELTARGGADVDERAEREPLEDDLHADHLGLPVGSLDDVLEDGLERGLGRVDLVEAADVPGEYLDVARLVHRLGAHIELGLVVRRAGHELARHHERALLAVEQLAEDPGGVVGVEYLELLLVEPLEEAELEERHPLAIEDLAARVD